MKNKIFPAVLFFSFIWGSLLSCSFGKNKIHTSEKTSSPSAIVDTNSTNKADSIPFFESYSTSVEPAEKVEMYELTWPSDDILCDSYNESDGPMSCSIFRFSSSKQIVCIREHGAFCQGDSDFNRLYFFDKQGNLIYSEAMGIYVPNVKRFYKSGKEVAVIESRGEGEEPYEPRISTSNSTEIITVKQFEQDIEDYWSRMKARLKTLKEMRFKGSQKAEKGEADALMRDLEAVINAGPVYEAGFVNRKPVKGEYSILTGTDIRVRAEPNSTSAVIGKVSYYDGDVEVTDIKGSENIEPFGTHSWYKIKYTDSKSHQAKEGWIFGAFILESIFKDK